MLITFPDRAARWYDLGSDEGWLFPPTLQSSTLGDWVLILNSKGLLHGAPEEGRVIRYNRRGDIGEIPRQE